MNRIVTGLLTGAAVCLSPLVSLAHVSIASGPGYATTSQLVTFGVGHGCEGADTISVEIDIPEGVASVRPEPSLLGPATLTRNEAGDVTNVKWEKIESSILEADDDYYRLNLRFKVPDAPFTKIFFPAHQICQAADGTITQVDWASTDPESMDEPAPALTILPIRLAGWNKFTVPAAIADLSVFFSDALVVWKEDAAYSANPITAELIKSTKDVTELTKLKAKDEIWVKY